MKKAIQLSVAAGAALFAVLASAAPDDPARAAAGASSVAPTREACRARMRARIAEIRATPNLQVPAGAPTYYLSEKSGDDAADGRTPATAWRTPARLAKASPARGSFVLFERGGGGRRRVRRRQRLPIRISAGARHGQPRRLLAAAALGRAVVKDWECPRERKIMV